MLEMIEELIERVLQGEDASDEVRNRQFADDGTGTIGEILRDAGVDALHVAEQRRPNYEDPQEGVAYTTDKSHGNNSTTGHQTQADWTTVASLERSDDDHWKEARPYVVDTSGGGNTTDVRLLMAKDPSAVNGDAPTSGLTDGDGFEIIDEVSGMASGDDWPDMATGYEVDSHLIVLQVQQGSGQETVDAHLTADRAK